MSTLQIIKDLGPQFAGYDDTKLSRFVDYAKLSLPAYKSFKGSEDMALALMALHLMTVSSTGGAAGSLIEEKVGDTSLKYADGGSDKGEDLSTTSYGKRLMELRRGFVSSTPYVTGTRMVKKGAVHG